jgi:hypothetical protein
MVYFPSLTYGLPSTSLTFKQITSIQRYAIKKFISGMGHDRSTPRSLIFGPTEFGGFGVRHLYTEMMGLKIDSIISHLRANKQLGQATKMNIDYLQLHTGIEAPILTSRESLTYISHNWLIQLWEFLLEINAKLDIQGLWIPKRQRRHDQFLMTAFINNKASRAELRILNNWRIYFQVYLLSRSAILRETPFNHTT